MVDTLRLQLWEPPPNPLPADDAGRKKHGPIYDLAVVQATITNGDQIYVATESCGKSLEDLPWDVDDVVGVIAVLRSSDYITSEWCMGTHRIMADADSYGLRYDHIDKCRGNLRHPSYYIKFGFRNNDPRLIMMLFQCHLSRYDPR